MSFEIENGVLRKYTEENGVTEVIIPNSVTSIGYKAFAGCSSLTSVTIPNSVTSIGERAFCDCSSLTSVTIPDSVTSIGEGAFCGCSSLTSVTIPNSVTSIGDRAFAGTKWLKVYPDDMVIINHILLAYKGNAETVVIPNSVTSIGNYAFFGCESLTSVTIPNSVTSIGSEAFRGCKSLTNLVLENKNGLKINIKEICEANASIGKAMDMLLTKDFSRKFSYKVKFKLIMDFFFQTDDEDAKAYIKKNFTKIMKQAIENGDLERISQLLEKTDFVTEKNIDKFIEYAIEKEQHEIYVILLNYKKEHIGSKSVEEQFKL
jgi:hypothetical protein